jgi:hypothetical protein
MNTRRKPKNENSSLLSRISKAIRDPVFSIILVLWTIPFFYRSPDGLDQYLLNSWTIQYALFLLGWSIFCTFLLIWRFLGNFKRAVLRFVLLLASSYFCLLLVSGLLWGQKRLSFLQNDGHWILDSELMTKHKPNFHWKGLVTHSSSRSSEDRVISIDLDEEGFRNPPPVPEKIDIAFLGDSFTFGGQVQQPELFSSLVSSELNLVGRNYGINGVGQGTQLGVLKRYVLQKKPRVVVLQFFDNDPADNGWYYQWKKMPRTEGEKGQWILGRTEAAADYPWTGIFRLQIPREIFKNLLFRASDRSTGFIVNFTDKKVHFYMPPWPNVYNTPPLQGFGLNLAEQVDSFPGKVEDPNLIPGLQNLLVKSFSPNQFSPETWRQLLTAFELESFRYLATKDLFADLIDTCRQNNCEVVIVHISTAWLTYRNKMTVAPGSPKSLQDFLNVPIPGEKNLDLLLRRWATKHGARYVSTLEQWKTANDFYYYRYEPHLNALGHRAVADILKAEIISVLQTPTHQESPAAEASAKKSLKR